MKDTFCYTTVRSDRRIFADEVNKQTFLKLLEKHAGKWRYEVSAFTVLDDQFHLLLSAEPASVPSRQCHEMMKELANAYCSYYEEKSGTGPGLVHEQISWQELEPREALNCCCDIHLAAVREGYTERMTDWWWSSFQTFRGAYLWRFLHIRHILRLFSDQSVSRQSQFLRYQRQIGKKNLS